MLPGLKIVIDRAFHSLSVGAVVERIAVFVPQLVPIFLRLSLREVVFSVDPVAVCFQNNSAIYMPILD